MKGLDILNNLFEKQTTMHMDWQMVTDEYKKDLSQFANLSMDELLYVIGRTHFAKRAECLNPRDIRHYPESVQTCINRTGNFIVFSEQLSDLYELAGGSEEDARTFVRNWNMKRPEVREAQASEMMIGTYSLQSLMEALCYDQENYFVCGERYEMASEFLDNVRSSIAADGVNKHFSGITYVDYVGDTSGDKLEGIKDRRRINVELEVVDEEALWITFDLERDGNIVPFKYNLLGKAQLQSDMYLMATNIIEIGNRESFIFSTRLVWLIDDQCEHFDFAVRFAGSLPEYVNWGKML